MSTFGSRDAKRVAGALLVGLAFVVAASGVHAGGLYLTEFGTPSQALSDAGAGVLAEDASTAWLNPAGIQLLDKSHWMVSGVGIFSKIEFEQAPGTSVTAAGSTARGSNGGDAGGFALGLTAFYAKPISERWGFGVSLLSLSGAALDYENKDDFVGRYWATEITLLTISIVPSFSVRLTDSLTFGLGVPVTMGVLELDVAIPAAFPSRAEGFASIEDGEDINASIQAGVLWEINDRTRLGVTYFSENDMEFDSDLSLELPLTGGIERSDIDVDVSIPFAQSLRLAGSRRVNDHVTLLATIAWEDWSTLDAVLISTSGGSGALAKDWDDTYKYAFGLRYESDSPWTWYTGAAYDTDPSGAAVRTADLPVDRQIRLSGGGFRKNTKRTLGWVVTLMDGGDAKIDNGGIRPISGADWRVRGEYDTNRIVFVGFNVSSK